jgi:hypothetical protein
MEFYQADPTLENYWRGVILFGRNVASYKFALASALYEVDKTGSDLITLDQLAVPFSRYLCEHLKHAPKQITSRSNQFLETCLKFNRGEITHAQLIEATVRLGFNNVIDAFHYVNQGEIDKRFFIDERKTNNGIRLTDNFFYWANACSIKTSPLKPMLAGTWWNRPGRWGFHVILWAWSSTKIISCCSQG